MFRRRTQSLSRRTIAIMLRSFLRRSTFSTLGMPTAAVVPPGMCCIPEEWVSLPLIKRTKITQDVNIFRFGTPHPGEPLNLSTCSCILASALSKTSGELIVRPYTPISTNELLGSFDLMVKIYPDGEMSQQMEQLELGDLLDFKHIPFNVKQQYPFQKRRIGMIAGGTGLTPMIQALHAILGTPGDETKVDLIYGSKTQDDLIDFVDDWERRSNGRLKVHHVLSDEPHDSDWSGDRGFIDEDLLFRIFQDAEISPEDDDVSIFVCGPDPMLDLLCGPRTETELKEGTVLADMGFNDGQIYKF